MCLGHMSQNIDVHKFLRKRLCAPKEDLLEYHSCHYSPESGRYTPKAALGMGKYPFLYSFYEHQYPCISTFTKCI